MTDLPTKLRENLKFDENTRTPNVIIKWDVENSARAPTFIDGAAYENARLSKVHEALVECLEFLINNESYLTSGPVDTEKDYKTIIANLEKVLSKD